MAGLIEFLSKASSEVGPAMKEVFGERVPNARLTGPKVAETAARGSPIAGLVNTGLLGMELNKALNPMERIPAIEKSRDEIGAMLWNKKNPEAAAQAQADMEGVANRAVDAGMSAVKAGSDQYKAEAAQGKHPIFQAAVQERATQVESQRQVVEAGAKEKLRTNQLSRPKAAEEVVKADIQRSGEKVSPDEFKTRVRKEVSSMKTMDDDQLSKYLSYALIAGGLIASHLDESGNAGKAFAGGFNAQLDRRQQMEMFKQKEKAAAEAAAAQAALEERKLGIQEVDVNSKITKREADAKTAETKTTALLDKWENEARIANEKLGAYRERTAATAGGSGKQIKGTPLSDKDNLAALDAYADAKGLEIDPAAKASLANQLKFLQKEKPGSTMETYVQYILSKGGYVQKPFVDNWGPFNDPATIKLQ